MHYWARGVGQADGLLRGVLAELRPPGNLGQLNSVRAMCRDLLFVIAVMAMSLAGPTARAQPASLLSLSDTAKIRLLIWQNARNVEIVRFADPRKHPIRIVRGRQLSSDTSGAPGFDEIARGQKVPVRILRGAPAVMAGLMAVVRVRPPLSAAQQVVASAGDGDRPVTVLRGMLPAALTDRDSPVLASDPCLNRFGGCGAELDRVAFAVDGAESSHGADPGMWRANLTGPQGPMQVSAAAAIDSGGGDRFDLMQNRQLGRAYLAQLFYRFGNWSDAVAAYNWGPGNMDIWIAQGRPALRLPPGVERYRDRVLRDGGIQQDPRLSLSRAALDALAH
jgi:Transglycosylase SLT domain